MADPIKQFQILSKNPNETADFYSALFGWTVNANNPMGYREINTGSIEGIHGGIWPAPPQAPNMVQLFAAVENVKTASDKAVTLGAKIIVPPTVLPGGDEMAVLQDPHGMPFGLMLNRK